MRSPFPIALLVGALYCFSKVSSASLISRSGSFCTTGGNALLPRSTLTRGLQWTPLPSPVLQELPLGRSHNLLWDLCFLLLFLWTLILFSKVSSASLISQFGSSALSAIMGCTGIVGPETLKCLRNTLINSVGLLNSPYLVTIQMLCCYENV